MTARPEPAALRTGPRPLPLHLLTALQSWSSCELGLSLSKPGSPNSNDRGPNGSANPRSNPPATDFRAALAPILAEIAAASPPPCPGETSSADDPFRQALRREVMRRLDRLAAGVIAYRDHPGRRALDDPPIVWSEGATALRDVGAARDVDIANDATPLLLVPSLVNRWQVLDLAPGRSFARALAAAGFRPWIVDWGTPGDAERALDTDGCVARLGRAVDWLSATTGARRLPALGYCMGGTLIVGLAAHRPGALSAIGILAAPWDFHADRAGQGMLAATGPMLAELAARVGELPADIVQTLFWSLDPWQVVEKFRRFAGMDMASDAARDFVLLEDWLNEGAALPGPVARDCLVGWYGDNLPGRGEWKVGGRPVRPAEIGTPALVAIPAADRIVPPASAAGLCGPAGLANATRLDLPLGHIGMMVGSRAAERCWKPVIAWLNQHR